MPVASCAFGFAVLEQVHLAGYGPAPGAAMLGKSGASILVRKKGGEQAAGLVVAAGMFLELQNLVDTASVDVVTRGKRLFRPTQPVGDPDDDRLTMRETSRHGSWVRQTRPIDKPAGPVMHRKRHGFRG